LNFFCSFGTIATVLVGNYEATEQDEPTEGDVSPGEATDDCNVQRNGESERERGKEKGE
jgi:hypothetical protein